MGKQRVVVTGMGVVSPFGEGTSLLWNQLKAGACALKKVDVSSVSNLLCSVAGTAPKINEKKISRLFRRTMSPMSIYAGLAAWEALDQAGLLQQDTMPRMGVSIGSTLGSPFAMEEFFQEYITAKTVDGVRSTAFFKAMSHTVASNVAILCGCQGRLLAPSCACASGLAGIGLAYEAIAAGKEQLMLCGGADERHVPTAATFDRMGIASHEQDPLAASRPFDAERSGLVVSEGAGVLVLESLESARGRHAPVLAEISGYASIASPGNIAHPDASRMQACMQEVLDDAGLHPKDIDYVNAHATATQQGDAAEGQAVEQLFGPYAVPVSSLKGHLGHTMGASGSIEAIACIKMLNFDILLKTHGIKHIDSHCGRITHIRDTLSCPVDHILKNAFALGGVYASLILSKRPEL